MQLESFLQYLDGYLELSTFPDYRAAHNGLQVAGPESVSKIAAAVDASERVIHGAVAAGCDLLLVHHGLFWDGHVPIVGRRYRKLRALIDAGIAVVSIHLPLDAHPEVGNCALLCRELGWEPEGRFGAYEGRELGWWARLDESREELQGRMEGVVGGPVRLIPGGGERIYRVGIVTGAASGLLGEAAAMGLDALITGEGPHHSYHDAVELGVNAYYAGHYATETFGVRALATHLAERFGLEWEFLNDPSGI